MNEIEKLSYDKIREKIDNLSDCDRGAYFHGWFDCLYFVQGILEQKENPTEMLHQEMDKKQ